MLELINSIKFNKTHFSHIIVLKCLLKSMKIDDKEYHNIRKLYGKLKNEYSRSNSRKLKYKSVLINYGSLGFSWGEKLLQKVISDYPKEFLYDCKVEIKSGVELTQNPSFKNIIEQYFSDNNVGIAISDTYDFEVCLNLIDVNSIHGVLVDGVIVSIAETYTSFGKNTCNIFTSTNHRRKGYAYTLCKYLLDMNIISTLLIKYDNRKSRLLARKLELSIVDSGMEYIYYE